MGVPMELKQMQYFLAIADAGSISAAAKKLYMSQPPLSAQMQRLEAELGCRLFERGARQITLTEAGRRFSEHARRILEMSRVAAEESRADSFGVLRLGMVSSVVESPGASWIAEYSARFPGLTFALTEGNTYRLLEDLRARLISLAVVRTPFAAEDLHAERLMRESLAVLGRREFFGGDLPQTVSPQLLGGVPLLVYRRWKEVVEQLCRSAGCEARIRFLCDDARTVRTLAEAGVGVAVLPQSGASGAVSEGMLCCPLCDESAISEIMLVSVPGRALSPCAAQFAVYLRERYGGENAL